MISYKKGSGLYEFMGKEKDIQGEKNFLCITNTI